MRQFFEGTVLHMLPVPGGAVAAVLSEITEDGKMAVEYRMLALQTNQLQRVSNNVYLLAKFGAGHKAAEMQVKNHLTCRACLLPNGEIFTVENDCSAKLLDPDGFAKWVGVVKYKGAAPGDALYDGANIWVSFPENNALIRMDTASLREELRIGGKAGESGFAGPVGLFVEQGELFVSNQTSMQIWKINTKTYAAEEYCSFEEPVYGYFRSENRELVHLKSGIYEL